MCGCLQQLIVAYLKVLEHKIVATMFTSVMDTVARLIVVMEFVEWCLHSGSVLVECTIRISYRFYSRRLCLLVIVGYCGTKITLENGWWLINATNFIHGTFK